MAYITKRENKSGTVYRLHAKIRVPGRKDYLHLTDTFYPEKGMSPVRAEKAAEQAAKLFEEEKKAEILGNQYLMEDPNITFAKFSSIWLEKTQRENSLSYYVHSRDLIEEINQTIGDIPLKKLEVDTIQRYFYYLDDKERIIYKVLPKTNFKEILISNGFNYNRLRYDLEIQCNTLSRAYNGKNVSKEWADNLAIKTGLPIEMLFDVEVIKKLYATETIDKYKRTIRAVLQYAIKKRILTVNYATSEYIDWGRRPKEDNRRKGMKENEAKKLVDYLLTHPDFQVKVSLITLLLTGVRKGELSGLEWKDIDFEEDKIYIKRSISEIKGYGAVEGDTKTGSSMRDFYLSPANKQLLLEYKEWQKERKTSLGDLWVESDKIFTKVHGGSIYPSYFNAQLNKALETVGLSHYSVHQIRHTNITLMISKGVPIPVASFRAGHARSSTTENTYAYAMPSVDQAAANMLDNLFFEKNNSRSTRSNISNPAVTEYRKAKEEMLSLGFDNYDEYLDYLEYTSKKRSRNLTA